MAYPYSKSETIADGVVHALGLALALPAVMYLVWQAPDVDASLWTVALYGMCLLASLMASAVYHMSPVDAARGILHRIDHAAIYLKIAGTYTPLVALIGSGFAYAVLALVWALALIGAAAKLTIWKADAKGSLALYLGMGWLSVLLIWPMWQSLPRMAVVLIVIGGLVYSAGTMIYAHPGMRYQNALWHLVVLGASVCFFAAVALSVQL